MSLSVSTRAQNKQGLFFPCVFIYLDVVTLYVDVDFCESSG